MTKRSEDGSKFGRWLSVSGGLGGFGWENTPADYLMATTNRSRWAFADFEGRVGRNDADVAAFSLGSVQVDEKRKFVIRYRYSTRSGRPLLRWACTKLGTALS